MIQLEHAPYSDNWPTVKTLLHLHSTKAKKNLESFDYAKIGQMDVWRQLRVIPWKNAVVVGRWKPQQATI
jgi:hypothetical protein